MSFCTLSGVHNDLTDNCSGSVRAARTWGLGIMSESRIAMLVALFLAAFLTEKTAIFFAAKMLHSKQVG